MLALSDDQLQVVMTTAGGLPPEKRSVFLERVAARLMLRGRFGDDDLDQAARLALQGLMHGRAAWMKTGADHDATKSPPDFLDEQMCPSEVAEVLASLHFRNDGYCLIELDRGVRDYLLRAIKPR